MKYTFFILCFLLSSLVFAQTKRVTGTHKMVIESHMSKDQAITIATEQARIQALADEFGTKLGQTNRLLSQTVNGQTDTKFSSLANSFVNGIWIDDVEEPEVKIFPQGEDQWVEVKVVGRAKHVPKADIGFVAKPLKCVDLGCETQDFKNGETLYFYFKSPVDGYLSLYYDDDSYCQMILPYQAVNESSLEIKADEEYFLFSPKYDYTGNVRDIDELQMWTDLDNEIGVMYVIFSTEAYFKPTMDEAGRDVKKRAGGQITEFPKQTDSKSFRKWLNKNLAQNDKLYLEVMDITISK